MALLNEIQKRFQIVRDSSISGEKRLFALLELVCAPVSFLTIFVFLPTMIWLEHHQAFTPDTHLCLRRTLQVMLAASVGYLTNTIALEMLFKPFVPWRWHPLTIVTLGYWRQGLVPRNKNQIGTEMGREVEEKLLDAQQISSELCETAADFLKNPEILTALRAEMQTLVKQHEDKIVTFFIPMIEHSLQNSIQNMLSTENLQTFWAEIIEPQLDSAEMRKLLAEKISNVLRERTPQFMELLRDMVREYVTTFLNEKLSAISFLMSTDMLARGFMSFVNWDNVQKQVEEKLSTSDTINTIGSELISLGSKLRTWLATPEADRKLLEFRGTMQEKFRTIIGSYLYDNLPVWADQMTSSPALWDWIEHSVLPSAQNSVVTWIRDHGQESVRTKLRLAERVQGAVEKQDVEEFYTMITHVAAQHLGAIQVLGFLLGGIVGLCQLLL